jgi:hypothetical protein
MSLAREATASRTMLIEVERGLEAVVVGLGHEPEVEQAGTDRARELLQLRERVAGGHHEALAVPADRDDPVELPETVRNPEGQLRVDAGEQRVALVEGHGIPARQSAEDFPLLHPVLLDEDAGHGHAAARGFHDRRLHVAPRGDPILYQQIAQPLSRFLGHASSPAFRYP